MDIGNAAVQLVYSLLAFCFYQGASMHVRVKRDQAIQMQMHMDARGNMSKKTIAFTMVSLIISLTVAMMGCQNAPEQPVGSSSNEPIEEVASPNAPERVTLSIMSTSLNIEIPGIQEDQVAKEIERRTGVAMKITNVMGDAIMPKILAMNASGDLPDMLTFDGDMATLKILIESNSLTDCSSMITEHLSNFMTNDKLQFALNFSKEYWSGKTGKLFAIPLNVGTTSSPSFLTAGTFIRWDYYKDLGYPEVNGIMDLLPLLQEFQRMHPKTKEGKSTYGVSFWSDWNLWPATVFGFIDGYGEGGDFGTIDISDEDFVPLLQEDSIFWKYITFYNKARQLGILDPDSFTQKFEQWSAKVIAGQVFFVLPGWMTRSFVGEQNEGFALIDTTGNANKCYSKYGNSTGLFAQVISKNCKTPKRALDLLNFFASEDGIRILNNGVQGQTWDIVNGKYELKRGILSAIKDPQKNDTAQYGYQKYLRLAALASGEKDRSGRFYDFTFEPGYIAGNLTAVEKDCARFYGVTLPSDIYNRKQYTSYSNTLMAAIPAFEEADYIRKSANITKYISDNWTGLVMAPDDTAFISEKGKFIHDLKAMGWDDVVSRFLQKYHATKAELDSLKLD